MGSSPCTPSSAWNAGTAGGLKRSSGATGLVCTRADLGHVVNDDRFLLLSGVRVCGLASLCSADGGYARGGTRGAAVGGLQPCRPRSPCYRAAGWKCCVARTSGPPPSRRAVAPKSVWIKLLVVGWRAAPCREPGLVRRRTCREMRTRPRCGARPDGRLRDRVVEMGRAWEHAPGASLPVISPGAVERKVRLLSNDRIPMEHNLERHQEAAVLTAAGWNRRSLRPRTPRH